MDTAQILRELRSELDRISRAITAMESLDHVGARRGGRSAATKSAGAARDRRRKGITPAGRKRLSEMMTARWVARRKSANVTRAASTRATRRRRNLLTPAGRKRLSEMMKARWAARRKKVKAR